jgi:integrase
MPKFKRHKIKKYPGVYFIEGTQVNTGNPEKIYYISYRKDGKKIEEKAGREFQHAMTPAKANRIRTERIFGTKPNNREQRERAAEQKRIEQNRKQAEAEKYDLDRLFKKYLESKPELKGRATDESRYELHLKPVFGSKEPGALVPLDIERLKRNITKKERKKKTDQEEELTPRPSKLEPVEAGTVRNVLELLRRIINFGVNMNLIKPLSFKIRLQSLNNERTEDLSPEQLKALLKALDKDADQAAANLMRLALYTGMRRGELLRLKWEDLDFERGFINIREPKGGKDQTIPLNSAACGVLEKHPRHPESPWVFPGKDPKKHASEMRKSIKRIAKAAGLPKGFRPLHGLRHSFASRLASSGQVDMYTLQKLLTHKSFSMTARYAHLRDDALKKASELAGDLFRDKEAEEKATG